MRALHRISNRERYRLTLRLILHRASAWLFHPYPRLLRPPTKAARSNPPGYDILCEYAPASFQCPFRWEFLCVSSLPIADSFRRFCADGSCRWNATAGRFKNQIEKARGRFPGAGFDSLCDDYDMPVICPTCQISLAPMKL
jgi:hypothetical protein